MNKFDSVFNSIDQDKSGGLNLEEFKIFINKLYENEMAVSDEAVENAFKFIDKSKNGVLDKLELEEKLPMYFPGIFDN